MDEPKPIKVLLEECSDLGLISVVSLAMDEMERRGMKPRGVLKMGPEWGVVTGEYDPPGQRARRN
jgi:hypothetical protein